MARLGRVSTLGAGCGLGAGHVTLVCMARLFSLLGVWSKLVHVLATHKSSWHGARDALLANLLWA